MIRGAPFDRWNHSAEVFGKLSAHLLARCVQALERDVSATAARTTIGAWRDARAGENSWVAEGSSLPHEASSSET